MKMADDTMKKKRGRPPLSDEERELRRLETNKKQAERLKRNGYAAQKKYQQEHREYYNNLSNAYKKVNPDKVKAWRKRQTAREKGTVYEPKLRLAIEYKPALEQLSHDTGMSINELCLSALEEKYGIILRKRIDKPEDK